MADKGYSGRRGRRKHSLASTGRMAALAVMLTFSIVGVAIYKGRIVLDESLLPWNPPAGQRDGGKAVPPAPDLPPQDQPETSTADGSPEPDRGVVRSGSVASGADVEPDSQAGVEDENQLGAQSLRDNFGRRAPRLLNDFPTPSEESIQKQKEFARKLFEEEYRQTKSTAARVALAKRVFLEGRRIENEPASTIALYQIAADMLAIEGEFSFALGIITHLSSEYKEIDTTSLKVKALMQAIPNVSSSQIPGLIRSTEQVCLACCRDGEVETARAVVSRVDQRLQTRNGRTARRGVNQLKELIARFERAAEQYRSSLAILELDPGSSYDNYQVGRYLAYYRRHWQEGLPYLAKGDQPGSRDAAAAELSSRTSLNPGINAAEAWFDVLAELEDPIAKESIRAHTLELFRDAKKMAKGLESTIISSRIEQLSAVDQDGPAKSERETLMWMNLLSTRANTSDRRHRCFASVNDREFELGMGTRVDGLGEAQVGFELKGVERLVIEGTGNLDIANIDRSSKCGFFVDYSTPAGFSKRVFLGLGLHPGRVFNESPPWGTQTNRPAVVTDIGRSLDREIALGRWAPANWDGRCWFTVYMQNAGPRRSIAGKLSWR